jgi:uncharacterized membrane protein
MSEMPPPTVPPATPPPPGGGSYTPPPPPPGGGYTPPPPPPTGGAPSSDRNVMIFLCYFGIFSLIPLLTKKDDPDIQWHAKNGLVLAIAYIPIWIILTIIGVILPGPLKLIIVPINCAFPILWLVIDIMAMVKAFGGQRMRIPLVTDLAEKM